MMLNQFISEAKRLQKLAGIHEAMIIPKSIVTKEKIPEGWESIQDDIGDERREGGILIRQYVYTSPGVFSPEYSYVLIFKLPGETYYTESDQAYQNLPIKSETFNSFNSAKDHAFKEMNRIKDEIDSGSESDDID